MHIFSVAVAALLISASTTPSFAEYPDRAIQIIVPYTPGGTVDILARALGARLTAAWGQPVVVLNRPVMNQSKNGIVVEEQPHGGSGIPAGLQVTIFVGRFSGG